MRDALHLFFFSPLIRGVVEPAGTLARVNDKCFLTTIGFVLRPRLPGVTAWLDFSVCVLLIPISTNSSCILPFLLTFVVQSRFVIKSEPSRCTGKPSQRYTQIWRAHPKAIYYTERKTPTIICASRKRRRGEEKKNGAGASVKERERERATPALAENPHRHGTIFPRGAERKIRGRKKKTF